MLLGVLFFFHFVPTFDYTVNLVVMAHDGVVEEFSVGGFVLFALPFGWTFICATSIAATLPRLCGFSLMDFHKLFSHGGFIGINVVPIVDSDRDHGK